MSRMPLVCLLPALALTGCELLELREHLCLSRVLEVAELGEEALAGADADARLEEALSTASSVLGDLPVMDCEAADSFAGLLDAGGGSLVQVWSADDLADEAGQLVDDNMGRGGEVALVIDTTGSMHDDTRALRSNIDAVLDEVERKNGTISVAFYGDNQGCDDDWYQRNSGGLLPADDPRIVEAAGNWEGALTGGCDWQESLYDAVWKTANGLDWQSKDRTIIVITDADAHDEKTNHSEAELQALLKQQDIVLDTILVGVAF